MKQNIVYGIHSVLKLLQHKANITSELLLQQNRNDQKMQELLAIAKNKGITLRFAKVEELDQLTNKANHQGIVAIVRESASQTHNLDNLLASLNKPPLLLILDGVQDPHNLGACMRTANAFGVDAVIAPKDSAVGLTDVVRKVACGAAEITPFFQVTNLVTTMKELKEQNIWFYGADLTATESIYDTKFSGGVGLVMGAEEKGMRRLTRENCDFLFKIPMVGAIESLNVSVATGVCLAEIMRQNII
jgi:23S rRNA (guanosine2251-2'-O)-methyltransferase